jgi:hypothetical protein
MKNSLFILSAIAALTTGCSSVINSPSLERKGSASVTKWHGGAIDVRVERKGPHVYEIRATGAPATSTEKALQAWKEVAKEVAAGRPYKENFKTRVGHPDKRLPEFAYLMGMTDFFMVDGEIVVEGSEG